MISNIILLWGLYLLSNSGLLSADLITGTLIKINPIFDLFKNRMIIKNEWLRWRLSHDVIYNERRARIIKRVQIRKINELFNNVCGSYYNYLYKYYSASEEDKYLIEFILSATY